MRARALDPCYAVRRCWDNAAKRSSGAVRGREDEASEHVLERDNGLSCERSGYVDRSNKS
jgi:hypothetical protein